MLNKVVDDLYFSAVGEGDGSKVHSLTLGELLIEANFGAGEVQIAIHAGYMDFIFLYGEPVAEILEAIEKAYVKVDDVPTEIKEEETFKNESGNIETTHYFVE